jgi:hypothetical protein
MTVADLLTDDVFDPGPGVHVVVHDDPLAAGRMVADRLGARLVETPLEAEVAVHHRQRLPELRAKRERLDQIEMLAWGLPEAEDASFLERERSLERVARRRRIDIAAVERIAALTKELEALEQVRTGTEKRVREEMVDALGAGAEHTVVLHPTSLRTAAARVRAAEEALADARLALDLVPVPLPSLPVEAPADAPAPPLPPAAARSSRVPLLVAGLGPVVAAGALVAGLPPLVGLVVLLAGAVGAFVLARRTRPAPALLQAAPAPVADRRDDAQADGRMARRTETVRELEERLRSARRDWGVAAGFDADPEDVDEVIRRRDPQFDLTADLVAAAPSARAVASVHRRVRADWRSMWAALGRTAPPPDKHLVTALVQDVRNVAHLPDEAAEVLQRTENRSDRARRRLALEAALGDDDLAELRRSTPPRHELDDRSLVLVSPFFPLAEQRRFQLRADLEALPEDVTVIVVVAHESEVPPRPDGEG